MLWRSAKRPLMITLFLNSLPAGPRVPALSHRQGGSTKFFQLGIGVG